MRLKNRIRTPDFKYLMPCPAVLSFVFSLDFLIQEFYCQYFFIAATSAMCNHLCNAKTRGSNGYKNWRANLWLPSWFSSFIHFFETAKDRFFHFFLVYPASLSLFHCSSEQWNALDLECIDYKTTHFTL